MAQTASHPKQSTGEDLAGAELSAQLEVYRRELTGYCYRLLGGSFDADDAVQETLLRAWRSYDRFEGRSSLRTWLYRIATNVCFDQLGSSRAKRERPMGLGAAADPVEESLTMVLPEYAWVEPVPTEHVLPGASDPADTAVARESVRLAFVAALQHLPAKQRAVLILREVLRWPAAEVATLLDVGPARIWVDDVLESCGVPMPLRRTVMLLTSEILTNAVDHGQAPFTATVEVDLDRLRVGVRDSSTEQPELRDPAVTEFGGRGVQFLERLASRWGVDRHGGAPRPSHRHGPPREGRRTGKTVWFELDLG